jgi:hypothetical protein
VAAATDAVKFYIETRLRDAANNPKIIESALAMVKIGHDLGETPQSIMRGALANFVIEGLGFKIDKKGECVPEDDEQSPVSKFQRLREISPTAWPEGWSVGRESEAERIAHLESALEVAEVLADSLKTRTERAERFADSVIAINEEHLAGREPSTEMLRDYHEATRIYLNGKRVSLTTQTKPTGAPAEAG